LLILRKTQGRIGNRETADIFLLQRTACGHRMQEAAAFYIPGYQLVINPTLKSVFHSCVFVNINTVQCSALSEGGWESEKIILIVIQCSAVLCSAVSQLSETFLSPGS
jgi:hypothetical protein